jgi:photosystem II stability/assembly factor-like uncharacterized protein
MKQLLGITLACIGLFGAGIGPAADAQTRIEPVVDGTAHEALFSIAFDGTTGVAVGAAGAILNSEDGGRSWKTLSPVPTPLGLLGVAVSQSRQIAVGQMGTVLLREGSGAWREAESSTRERLFAVSLNSRGVAAAVGSFGTVLKSDDAGRSWKAVAPDWAAYVEDGVQPHIYDVDVDDSGAITVVGEFGLIARSTDGGARWTPLHKGEASLFALDLLANGTGYAVGQDGTLLRSADGGAHWTAIDVQTRAILLDVHASDDGRVVVAGMRDLVVSRDGGDSWQHVTNAEINASWYGGVAQPGAGAAALAAGHAGQIIRVGG